MLNDLSSGNFASGMEMEIIPPISILKHHPTSQATEEFRGKEAPVHTVWPPSLSAAERCSQVWCPAVSNNGIR